MSQIGILAKFVDPATDAALALDEADVALSEVVDVAFAWADVAGVVFVPNFFDLSIVLYTWSSLNMS